MRQAVDSGPVQVEIRNGLGRLGPLLGAWTITGRHGTGETGARAQPGERKWVVLQIQVRA